MEGENINHRQTDEEKRERGMELDEFRWDGGCSEEDETREDKFYWEGRGEQEGSRGETEEREIDERKNE